MEKCKDCQDAFKKVVKWWIVKDNQNFNLCQPCSDKRNRELTKLPEPKKEVVEIDWWKVFFFLSTITLFIILLIVVLNKQNK